MKKPKMTPVVTMHYIKLFLRGSLFLAALVTYIIHAVTGTGSAFGGFENNPKPHWGLQREHRSCP